MRVGLIGQVRRGWAPGGVKVVQAVEYKREWAYLNWAVNGLTGQLRWDWTQNMRAASIAPIVNQWATEGLTVLVWDRTRGHRGEAYSDVPVKLIEPPPYSPELNPAERLFEYLRSKVEGKIYGKLEVKKATIEVALAHLVANPDKVKSLAGWDWIRQSVEALSIPITALN